MGNERTFQVSHSNWFFKYCFTGFNFFYIDNYIFYSSLCTYQVFFRAAFSPAVFYVRTYGKGLVLRNGGTGKLDYSLNASSVADLYGFIGEGRKRKTNECNQKHNRRFIRHKPLL